MLGSSDRPRAALCCAALCRGVADSPRDFWYGVHEIRVHGITNMLLEAFHWVQSHYLYW